MPLEIEQETCTYCTRKAKLRNDAGLPFCGVHSPVKARATSRAYAIKHMGDWPTGSYVLLLAEAVRLGWSPHEPVDRPIRYDGKNWRLTPQQLATVVLAQVDSIPDKNLEGWVRAHPYLMENLFNHLQPEPDQHATG